MSLVILLVVLFSILTAKVFATEEPPPAFADIHLHFNWDQKEVISADEIVEKLKAENVTLAVVSSVPSHLAKELHDAGGDWLIPLFSPYITPLSRNTWYKDKNVLVQAEQGLAQRQYFGIGELHLWDGVKPGKGNEILLGLLDLAEQYAVPFLIHTEASDSSFLLPICQSRPNIRFLWAHAGGNLKANSVRRLMQQCGNVWVELSARDPWRYNTLSDNDLKLLPPWRELLLEFPERFMTGTDPVWSVRKNHRWDEADEGWDHYKELLNYHRQWLNQLPPDIAEKIRIRNAKKFFAIK